MIIFHRKVNDPKSELLEEKLENLVIAYKTVEHESGEEDLPYIEEDGNKMQTQEEIQEWMATLESELKWQRSLSGDGCYIDPMSGKIC
ncbi:MAG: hypothetical protein WD022_05260 [Balneolaceae bacterium]